MLGCMALIGVFLALGLSVPHAHANPSFFARAQNGQSCSGAALVSTSTFNGIAIGSGTTTVNYCASGANFAADSAVLDLQMSASTTAPSVGVRIEHSYDGIDWYGEVPITTNASTTDATFGEETVTFATSSVKVKGATGSGSASRIHLSFPIATPTRFTRAVIYGSTGSGSLYAEIVAKQQVN